jgi:hypothetical protein
MRGSAPRPARTCGPRPSWVRARSALSPSGKRAARGQDHWDTLCFDRILFRGYLPIMSGAAMALYFKIQGVRRETVKAFVLEQAARLKMHALD